MRSSIHRWPEQRRGADNPRARFTAEQVQQMRDRHELGGVTVRQLAEEYGAGRTTVARILNRERYQE